MAANAATMAAAPTGSLPGMATATATAAAAAAGSGQSVAAAAAAAATTTTTTATTATTLRSGTTTCLHGTAHGKVTIELWRCRTHASRWSP